MRMTATNNELNAIRNALDKESKVAIFNAKLIEKMDYLVANNIADESLEEVIKIAKDMAPNSQEAQDKIIIETIAYNLLRQKFGEDILQSDVDKLTKNAKMLPVEFFDNNPYINNIKFENETFGDLKMLYTVIEKYHVTEYSGAERKNLIFYPCWGYIKHDTKQFILQNQITKKAPVVFIPCEMIQTQNYIDQAKGKVLNLGLKVGYFAYLAGLKDDVTEITIIEEDTDIIGFFNSYILPQFDEKVKNKITLIKSNPIEYMKYLPDGQFDYCFVDLWCKHTNTKPYCDLMPIHNKFKIMQIAYYKELRIVDKLYEIVLFNIYFALQKRLGSISKEENFVEHFKSELTVHELQFIEIVFADYKIKTLKDLMNLLSFEFLLKKFNSIEYIEE